MSNLFDSNSSMAFWLIKPLSAKAHSFSFDNNFIIVTKSLSAMSPIVKKAFMISPKVLMTKK